jgi:hypothetical protein
MPERDSASRSMVVAARVLGESKNLAASEAAAGRRPAVRKHGTTTGRTIQNAQAWQARRLVLSMLS